MLNTKWIYYITYLVLCIVLPRIYLQQFVIGSALGVTGHFLTTVGQMDKLKIDYFEYSLMTPLYLGFINVMGYFMAGYLGLSNLTRYVLTAMVGVLIPYSVLIYNDLYEFESDTERLQYLVLASMYYLFAFAVVANYIDTKLI